jgi:hypothetical protein
LSEAVGNVRQAILVADSSATRYDRLARNYLAALALVATVSEWAK